MLASSAFGQSPVGASLDASEDQTRATLGAFRRLDPRAEAALFEELDADRRVAFAEVLQNPDDPELNFRWAQTQVADGDPTGASATLQRILLNQPDLHRVRVFYGVVLLALGSLEEADTQLRTVERVEAPRVADALRAEVRRYREQIRQQNQRTRSSLLLAGGSIYDSNKNSGPVSDQISFFDTRISLGTSDRRQSDSGWFSVAQWTTEHDLGRQEDQQIVATAAYFHLQQDDLRLYDVQALHFEAGLRTRRTGNLLHPRVVADLIDLSRENYLRSVGIELEARHPLSARIDLAGRARITHEDFDGTPDAATASERSGFRSLLTSELSIGLSPYHGLALGAELTHKSADQTYHSYSGWRLRAAHQWSLPGGASLLSSASLGFDRYKKNQDSISTSKRRDLHTRVGLTLGLPFAAVLGGRLPSLRDAILSIGGEARVSRSNLPNYAFRNRQLTVTVAKQLSF